MNSCLPIFLTFFFMINGFPSIEDIQIIKNTNGTCSIPDNIEIIKLTCQKCSWIKQSGSYQITTTSVQLIKVHIRHDGSKVIEVPFSVNCNNKKTNLKLLDSFKLQSHLNSVVVKLNENKGFRIIYFDREGNCVVNHSKPVTEYRIVGLLTDKRYTVCMSAYNQANETGRYKCIVTKTTQLQDKYPFKRQPQLGLFEVNFMASKLIGIKWKLTGFKDYKLGKLVIRLYEKNSRKYEEQINVEYLKRNSNTIENKPQIKNDFRMKNVYQAEIESGQLQLYWPKLTVQAEMTVLAKDGSILDRLKSISEEDNDHFGPLSGIVSTSKVTCYADCLSDTEKYTGIRSQEKHGRKCTKWSDSVNYSKYKIKSNWCASPDNSTLPWCPIGKKDKGYCDIPLCETNDNKVSGCVKLNYIRYSETVLYGTFETQSTALGYLIMLLSEDDECVQFILYGLKEISVKRSIQSFFHGCKKQNEAVNEFGKYAFFNLKSLKRYTIYIVPIDDERRVGKVTYFSEVPRVLKKPRKVNKVSLSFITVSSLNVSWEEPPFSKQHGYVQKYKVVLTESKKEVSVHYVDEKMMIFRKLKECKEYCVTVYSRNDAGLSELSETVCKKSLQNTGSGSIHLKKIKSNPNSYRLIKWIHYNKLCESSYRVIYWVSHGSLSCQKQKLTNLSHIFIDGLLPNTSYELKVQLNTKINGNMKLSSNIQSFYTGDVIDNVKLKYSKKIIKQNNNKLSQIELQSRYHIVFVRYELIIRKNIYDGKCLRRMTIQNMCQKGSCVKNINNHYNYKMNNLRNSLTECSIYLAVKKIECKYGIIRFNFTEQTIQDSYYLQIYGESGSDLVLLYQEYKGSFLNSKFIRISIIVSISGVLFIFVLVVGCSLACKLRIQKEPPEDRLSNIYDE